MKINAEIIKRIIGILLLIHFCPALCYFVDRDNYIFHWYITGMLVNLTAILMIGFGMLCVWLIGGFTE